MPYVSRNEESKVNGTYANAQPGYAEEFLEDNDPEVVAFLDAVNNPSAPPPSQGEEVLFDHENRLRALEGQPPLTMDEFKAKGGIS